MQLDTTSIPETKPGNPPKSREWGPLPDSVARNPNLSAHGLVAIAVRATFANDVSKFGLSISLLRNAVRSGFGRDKAERTITEIVDLGYLVDRHQPPPKRRRGKVYSQYAKDRLVLTDTGNAYQVVQRRWFNGELSVNELAAFLYMRAGTGRGPMIYAREVQARFSWGREVTRSVIQALIALRLIARLDGRHDNGQLAGTAYEVLNTPNTIDIQASETVARKSGLRSSGFRSPGSRKGGHKRKAPSTTASSTNPTTTTNYAAAAPSSAAPKRAAAAVLVVPKRTPLPFDALDWINDDNAAEAQLHNVPIDVLADMEGVVSDVELATAVREACDGRVGAKILGPEGLHGIRHLAAFIQSNSNENQQPVDSIRAVVLAMWDAVGSRQGRRLNSLALIGCRIAAHIYSVGDCHGGRFYKHAPPYVLPAERRKKCA